LNPLICFIRVGAYSSKQDSNDSTGKGPDSSSKDIVADTSAVDSAADTIDANVKRSESSAFDIAIQGAGDM
jgi:hypothetical protein